MINLFLNILILFNYIFSELVYSVKEGWRREDPMKNAEELMYFSMITSCLKYERLVLLL